jgi:hypothetical protein
MMRLALARINGILLEGFHAYAAILLPGGGWVMPEVEMRGVVCMSAERQCGVR